MGKPVLELYQKNRGTIDLLDKRFGYFLCDMTMPRPKMNLDMETHVFSGRQYARDMVHDPLELSITLQARDVSQDQLIKDERRLNKMLQYANLYSTESVADNPVYLRMKPKDATVMMWARVLTAQYHDSGNPFAAPFAAHRPLDRAVVVGLTLDYFEPIPGTGYPLLGSGGGYPVSDPYIGDYSRVDDEFYGLTPDSLFSGNEDYIAPSEVVANYVSQTNITHVYIDTSTTNALENTTSYVSLLNGLKWTYFGSTIAEPTLTDEEMYGVFTNIVLPYQRDNDDEYQPFQVEMEYGVAGPLDTIDWLDVEVVQHPTLITHGYVFHRPSSWNKAFYNGVEAYWIRMRKTSGLQESSRLAAHPYAANWNHMIFPEGRMGDIGMRIQQMKIDIVGTTNTQSFTSTWGGIAPTRIFMGARRLDDNYTSYKTPAYQSQLLKSVTSPAVNTWINFIGDDSYWDAAPYASLATGSEPPPNNSGSMQRNSVSYIPKTWLIETTTTGPYRKRGVYYNPLRFYKENETASIARVTLNRRGRFRAFLRFATNSPYTRWRPQLAVKGNATSEVFYMYAEIGSRRFNNPPNPSDTDTIEVRDTTPVRKFPCVRNRIMVLDLGSIELDGSYEVINFLADVSASPVARGMAFYIYDLVLIPNDLFFIDMKYRIQNEEHQLKILESPRGNFVGEVNDKNGISNYNFGSITSTPDRGLVIPCPEPFAMYFFMAHDDPDMPGVLNSRYDQALNVKMDTVPLFVGAIGDGEFV